MGHGGPEMTRRQGCATKGEHNDKSANQMRKKVAAITISAPFTRRL